MNSLLLIDKHMSDKNKIIGHSEPTKVARKTDIRSENVAARHWRSFAETKLRSTRQLRAQKPT